MASIIADLSDDIKKMKSLKEEIQQVKKELGSINVKVELDIKRDMEAKLKSLTSQYDALVKKVSEAEGKVIASTQRINQAAEKIIKAQEQLAKATGAQPQTGNASSGANAVAANAETASVQAQAKAYDELADEIDAVMGTRTQNIRRMIEEQNAIRIINEELKRMQKLNQSGVYSQSEIKRMEQLNASLLQHKTALSELRQSLNNSFKLDNAAATSMNALSQSLARMRMTYRELTEEERNSPFGQELLASIQQADAKIKQLDASIGNHQRNVGNYASGWNGLNMSIQQIGRELPSLAMGWNTFFLAISNNLPILSDELARARKEYNELKAAGQQATPVWKQVVSSLLSWQTALTVGITLLTLYGKDIIEWVGNLFKAKDGTKELEEAMKRLNTAISSVYGNASEEMRVLKDLNKSLENAKRGTEEWNQIRNKLVTGYSKYLPSIDQEIDKTGTLANSYDRLAESIQKAAAARGFEELKSNEDKKYADSLIKTYQDVSKRLVSLYGEEQGRAYFEGWKRWLERLNNGEELSAKVQGAYGNVSMSSWNPFNDDTLNSLMQDLNKQYKAREKALDEYRKIFGITEGAEDNIASDSIKALRDRIAANREALEKLSVSSKEYKDLLERIQQDEQKLQKLTMTPDKQGKQYNSIKEQQDKIDELLDKQSQARIRQQVDLENQVEQARIDAMADGAEKVRDQRELDNKKELEAIERQKEEYKQKVIQSQKEIFDAQEELKTKQNPNYKKGSFDSSSVSVDTSMFDIIYDFTQKKQVNDRIREQEEAMNRYLQEYGTFQQKREAIAQEYSQKIANTTIEGEKLLLQKQMEEALSGIDMDELKESINWELVFSDLGNVSKKSLQQIKKQLGDFKESAEYKDMGMEQKKVVDEALNNIQSAIIDKGGLLGDLPTQLEELRKAQEDLTQAQEEYNKALAEGTDEQKETARKKLNKSQQGVQNAQLNVERSTKTATDNLLTLADAITQLGGNSEITLSEIGQLAGGIADTFAEAGSKIGGIIGAIFTLLDQIGKQGLDGFLENVFSSVGSALYGVFDTLLGWGGFDFGGESDPTLERDIERLTTANQELEKAINNLSDKMDESSLAEALDIYEVQKENIQKMMANTRDMMYRSVTASSDGFLGIGGHHSSGYKIDNGMSAQDWEAISKVIGRQINGAGEFFMLSSEEMWKVANEATTEYAKLKELADDGYKDAAQFMDEYIGYWQELENLENEYSEKLTSVSFDTIRNDFRNALLGMEDDAEAFSENFEKMMKDAVLESMMTEKYDKRLKDWYKLFSGYMEGGYLGEGEQDDLRDEWQGIVNDALEEWKHWQKIMGWDTESSANQQQSASSGGFETMTQDQASELNGRFTALNESSLRQEAIQQGISDIADDMRNIIAQSYLELQQISENTGEIIKPIKQMQLDIAEVKRNTSRI